MSIDALTNYLNERFQFKNYILHVFQDPITDGDFIKIECINKPAQTTSIIFNTLYDGNEKYIRIHISISPDWFIENFIDLFIDPDIKDSYRTDKNIEAEPETNACISSVIRLANDFYNLI
jgi:hypothetical protein